MSFKNYLNVYEFDTTLPGTGAKLKIKPITTGIMKELLLYESATDEPGKIEEALDTLLQKCVITPGFNVDGQFLQDRFFLITELRKVTRGNKYTFQATCQKCNGQAQQTVDLSKLVVKPNTLASEVKETPPVVKKVAETRPGLHVKKETPKKEEVPVIVEKELKPVSVNTVQLNDNISVELSLITRGMQKQAMKIVTDMKKEMGDMQRRAEIVTITTAQAIKAIITPEGKEIPSLEDRVYFINNINQGELEKLTQWLQDHDFGIDFSFDTVCPHCGDKQRREVPIEDFFS
jgi:rRNA maturation protein Nop10